MNRWERGSAAEQRSSKRLRWFSTSCNRNFKDKRQPIETRDSWLKEQIAKSHKSLTFCDSCVCFALYHLVSSEWEIRFWCLPEKQLVEWVGERVWSGRGQRHSSLFTVCVCVFGLNVSLYSRVCRPGLTQSSFSITERVCILARLPFCHAALFELTWNSTHSSMKRRLKALYVATDLQHVLGDKLFLLLAESSTARCKIS